MALSGNFWVRATHSGFGDVDSFFRHKRDKAEIRRHALKLRYYPSHSVTEPSGQVVDLDYSVVQALKGLKIFELRIDDVIGGRENLRIIFFVGPDSPKYPMTCIWILAVFPKKRDDFTVVQLNTFRLRRLLVLERFYND